MRLALGLLVLLAACAPTKQETTTPKPPKAKVPLHEIMQEHFVHLDDMQKAVIRGDLDLAKLSAQWVMDHHVETRNEGWRPHLEKLEQASSMITSAPDLAQAALGAAQVAGACGDCHEAHGIDLDLSAPPLEEGTDTKSHMKRHQWAADRLWDAVVGNSDKVWLLAAAALSDVPLHLEEKREGPDDMELEMVNTAAEVVHRIGATAKDIKERPARVRALGEFLSTCSACHTQLNVELEN